MTVVGNSPGTVPAQTAERLQALLSDVQRVRQRSQWICEHLEIEDFGVQPMPDASPPKWHLAHTNWFFETFLIKRFLPVASRSYQLVL